MGVVLNLAVIPELPKREGTMMKMPSYLRVVASFLPCLFFLWAPTHVLADVSPRDRIDRTNWQKAEGLLPDPILEWVKKGDFVLQVEELPYDPAEFFFPFYLESRKKHVGKYGLNEKEEIIETATGKPPNLIMGTPFPEIDPGDPKAAIKIMYNKLFADGCSTLARSSSSSRTWTRTTSPWPGFRSIASEAETPTMKWGKNRYGCR